MSCRGRAIRAGSQLSLPASQPAEEAVEGERDARLIGGDGSRPVRVSARLGPSQWQSLLQLANWPKDRVRQPAADGGWHKRLCLQRSLQPECSCGEVPVERSMPTTLSQRRPSAANCSLQSASRGAARSLARLRRAETPPHPGRTPTPAAAASQRPPLLVLRPPGDSWFLQG